MADVFVSYSSYDRESARLVAESLEAAGLSVWWDRELKPGQTLHTVVKRAIESAKAVVVLWTPQSVASHLVCEEAEEA